MTDAGGDEQRNWREVEAGRLPLRAQQRIAMLTGSFSSGLGLGGQLAVEQAGLVPVGQVMGLSVVHPGRWSGGSCGVDTRSRQTWTLSAVQVYEVPMWRDALVEGWHRATARLLEEAALLGADGVVDVACHEDVVAGGGLVHEMRLTGTAVRTTGTARPTNVFASAVDGPRTAALLRAGWAPVAVLPAVEIVVRHDEGYTNAMRESWRTGELPGYGELLTAAYTGVRRRLLTSTTDVGADGVVLASLRHTVMARACSAVQTTEDHLVRVTAIGTGLVRVPSTHGHGTRATVTIGLGR